MQCVGLKAFVETTSTEINNVVQGNLQPIVNKETPNIHEWQAKQKKKEKGDRAQHPVQENAFEPIAASIEHRGIEAASRRG